MKANDTTLRGILNGPNQYVIPVFQRYYSWRQIEWESLWDNILELFDPDQPARTHFMGSLVFVPEQHYPDHVPAYQVIDGQQRMVTLSLVLCALRHVATVHEYAALSQEISQTFLVHPFRKGREHFRVYPRQRDRQQYLDAVENRQTDSGQIAEALDFFAKHLEALPMSATEEGLRQFFDALVARLEFVHITLEGENPYRIFRSLNSIGVELGESDLIRNFMFMHLPIDHQDQFDEEWWTPLEAKFSDGAGRINVPLLSSFFRDYLMRNGQYVQPATTFQTFERTYQGEPFDGVTLVRTLRTHAAYYDVIRGVQLHPDPHIRAALTKLRELDTSTTYPLLLQLLQRAHAGQISDADLVQTIELMSGFILRRFVCGDTSRTYGRWFVSACNALGSSPVDGLYKFFDSKGFPNDARFKAQFSRFGIYGSRYGRTVLEALEQTIPDKERASLSQATIEHIMPQTLTPEWREMLGPDADRVHSEWLNTIGNLTLSGYNSELQNKPFIAKRKDYRQSNINLTRQLADYSTWTEQDIAGRGEQLADAATRIWIGPGV